LSQVVQHDEVDAFQWFLHLIAELEHTHFKQRQGATTDDARREWNKYYCEIHMFVTRAPPKKCEVKAMVSPSKFLPDSDDVRPTFTAEQLYAEMRNPSVKAIHIREAMESAGGGGGGLGNRLQDTWVWNGRPDWDQVQPYPLS
jgi:hypothetical protein